MTLTSYIRYIWTRAGSSLLSLHSWATLYVSVSCWDFTLGSHSCIALCHPAGCAELRICFKLALKEWQEIADICETRWLRAVTSGKSKGTSLGWNSIVSPCGATSLEGKAQYGRGKEAASSHLDHSKPTMDTEGNGHGDVAFNRDFTLQTNSKGFWDHRIVNRMTFQHRSFSP